MSRLRLFAAICLIALFAGPIGGALYLYSQRIHVFSGIAGPLADTIVAPSKPTDWREYDSPGDTKLAVLLTDDSAPWLALTQGLKSRGIPFTLTKDTREALKHKAILIYPMVSGRLMPGADLQALAQVPHRGGTLIAANVLGGLQETFGLSDVLPGRDRFEIRWSEPARRQFAFTEPEEEVIRLGNRDNSGTAQIGTYGYRGTAEVLAAFEDGTAAVTWRQFPEGGSAYALGFDPGSLLLAGQAARGQDLERDYVNAFSPQNDVLIALIEKIWRLAEPLAVSLSPVPDGKPLAIMLTHDIDYTKSLESALVYAREERARGVTGTFFVQTKYMRDYNDEIILTDGARDNLNALRDLGVELASHTVSHSRTFRNFELGTGTERYPDYRPLATDRDAASGGTILGELRVSKFLIEELAKSAKVVSFRPGHLSYPFGLPQALEATGYSFSSSVTAGNALSHLPFRLAYERGSSALTTVFEFPVTVEDEKSPFLGMRIDQSIDIARKISRRGGIFVLLVHPNILGHKLEFVSALIERMRDEAWFGPLERFGRWWATRDKVSLDSTLQGDRLVVHLNAAERIHGLTVSVPDGWQLTDRDDGVRQGPRGLVLDDVEGRRELVLTRARHAKLP